MKLHHINVVISHITKKRQFVRTVFKTLSRNRKQYAVQTFGIGIWYWRESLMQLPFDFNQTGSKY